MVPLLIYVRGPQGILFRIVFGRAVLPRGEEHWRYQSGRGCTAPTRLGHALNLHCPGACVVLAEIYSVAEGGAR